MDVFFSFFGKTKFKGIVHLSHIRYEKTKATGSFKMRDFETKFEAAFKLSFFLNTLVEYFENSRSNHKYAKNDKISIKNSL